MPCFSLEQMKVNRNVCKRCCRTLTALLYRSSHMAMHSWRPHMPTETLTSHVLMHLASCQWLTPTHMRTKCSTFQKTSADTLHRPQAKPTFLCDWTTTALNVPSQCQAGTPCMWGEYACSLCFPPQRHAGTQHASPQALFKPICLTKELH